MSAPKTEALMNQIILFVDSVKGAQADDATTIAKVTEIITAAVSDLVPAISDAEAIPAEYAADQIAVWKAVAAGVAGLIGALIAKG